MAKFQIGDEVSIEDGPAGGGVAASGIDQELDTMTPGTRTGEDRYPIRKRADRTGESYSVWDTEGGEYLADAAGRTRFDYWRDARDLQQEYAWS